MHKDLPMLQEKLIPNELEIREQLQLLESSVHEALDTGDLAPVECPLKHHFTEGVYAREILLPKHSFVIGKIHRHEHLNFLSEGSVLVLTKEGMKELHAPCTMISPAGVKRAVFALEDTVWTTVHANPTNETDLEKIEAFTIAKTYLELPDSLNTAALEGR